MRTHSEPSHIFNTAAVHPSGAADGEEDTLELGEALMDEDGEAEIEEEGDDEGEEDGLSELLMEDEGDDEIEALSDEDGLAEIELEGEELSLADGLELILLDGDGELEMEELGLEEGDAEIDDEGEELIDEEGLGELEIEELSELDGDAEIDEDGELEILDDGDELGEADGEALMDEEGLELGEAETDELGDEETDEDGELEGELAHVEGTSALKVTVLLLVRVLPFPDASVRTLSSDHSACMFVVAVPNTVHMLSAISDCVRVTFQMRAREILPSKKDAPPADPREPTVTRVVLLKMLVCWPPTEPRLVPSR